MNEIYINPPFIKLEQFLKLAGAVSTGGQAKLIISDGSVKVDGSVCLMRGKKLRGSETVEIISESGAATVGEIYKCILKE